MLKYIALAPDIIVSNKTNMIKEIECKRDLLLLIILSMLRNCWSHEFSIRQCERLIVPECQKLGYNSTIMPNIVGHKSQAEAQLMVIIVSINFMFSFYWME